MASPMQRKCCVHTMTAPAIPVVFDDKEIAGRQGYLTHLNQYHVINLDITGFISDATRMDIPLSNVPNMIADAIYILHV